MSLFQKWQILMITYWDDTRTKEMRRCLFRVEYWRYKTAMREVRRHEEQDTLENRFCYEYVVVKAI